MKYSININNKVMVELGLSVIEGAIFDCIKDCLCSPSLLGTVISGKNFKWVSYGLILSEIPNMGLSGKRALRRRIDKIKGAGLLECFIDASDSRTYFSPGPAFDMVLTDSDRRLFMAYEEQGGGRSLTTRGVVAKVQGGWSQKSTYPSTKILVQDPKKEPLTSLSHSNAVAIEQSQNNKKPKKNGSAPPQPPNLKRERPFPGGSGPKTTPIPNFVQERAYGPVELKSMFHQGEANV